MKTYSDGIVTVLILEKGEPILENLKRAAVDLSIQGAFLTGIGAVQDVSVGFFDKESKTYKENRFEGPVELLALNGNIAWEGENPVVHLHALMGYEDGSVVGGHLLEATVAVTLEIFVHKFGKRLDRARVEDLGLSLIA